MPDKAPSVNRMREWPRDIAAQEAKATLCVECGEYGSHKGTCSRSAMRNPAHPFHVITQDDYPRPADIAAKQARIAALSLSGTGSRFRNDQIIGLAAYVRSVVDLQETTNA